MWILPKLPREAIIEEKKLDITTSSLYTRKSVSQFLCPHKNDTIETIMKLSTESYKGVRDFYPEDMYIERYMFDVMRQTAESFGYVEYGASILEPTELYRGKTSEEIVNDQTYTFTDRGGREVTLRPEMTPTVARMIAGKRRELSFPARWYSIPNVFRYEQPQRGRLREHWQFNADIFGVGGREAEVEIVSMAYALFETFGAKPSDFEILVNSREVLEALWSKFDLNPEQQKKVARLMDARDKMPAEKFDASLADIVANENTAHEIKKAFESEENFAAALGPDSSALRKLQDIIKNLHAEGVKNVKLSPSLIRGFDYYTGFVFEIFDTDPKNRRSLAGGGRYDNLLSAFGVEPLPTVGFGLGDVTLRDFLETHGLLPEYRSSATLFVAVIGEDEATKKMASDTVRALRSLGISVVLDYTDRAIGDKIKKATKDSVPFFVAIGDNEVSSSTMTVKNLATKEETSFPTNTKGLETLVEYIHKNPSS